MRQALEPFRKSPGVLFQRATQVVEERAFDLEPAALFALDPKHLPIHDPANQRTALAQRTDPQLVPELHTKLAGGVRRRPILLNADLEAGKPRMRRPILEANHPHAIGKLANFHHLHRIENVQLPQRVGRQAAQLNRFNPDHVQYHDAAIMSTQTDARRFGLAALAYTGLVLLLFHDLFGRFSTAVPHDLGDPLLSAWILWWNAYRVPFLGSWWDGLSFFPGTGSLALSDHRVGLALIASPILWMGGTPALAYNITLLASFVLCALAAHALAWTLTGSHAAGAVSGLIFGFNPFRISHIAHLELLAVFWLPLALLALHRYVAGYERRWLFAFAACWALQGLSSGYYLFYSAPLVGLWAIWFARGEPWRGIGAILLACVATVLALLPVLLGYRAIQEQLNLSRSFAEIESFSADITGILSATPIMALWRVPSLAANGEGEIYIGIFAPLLVAAGCLWRPRDSSSAVGRRLHTVRLGVAVVCVVYTLIAVGTLLGSWSLNIGPLKISASQTVQPLSIAVFCLAILGVTSPGFVDAFRRRSIFAFYAVAALTTWLFTLGPRPRLLGELVIYRGPYALLMLVPGFDERLRVPARFVMITILAVAVAAGIALIRATASAPRPKRLAVTILALLAITADSWTFSCPMPAVPPFLPLPDGVPDSAAVLELPLGNVGPDIAAVYRSIGHGHPVVNGYSGYDPPHYRVLRPGIAERDGSALTTLTRFAPILIAIAEENDRDGGLAGFAAEQPGAVRLAGAAGYTFYLLPQSGVAAEVDGQSLPIRNATFEGAPLDLKPLTDGNPDTAWSTSKPQDGGEELVLELDDVHQVTGVSLSTGPLFEGFPRWLAVAASIDGIRWEEVWSGGMAGPVVEAILKDPRTADGRIAFASRPARYLRLRQLRAHTQTGWVIAELKAYGSAAR